MNDLLFDLRYVLRQFNKTLGITLVAVLTLALGIGASTGIFTLAWNVILKSLPVPRASELVQYEMNNGSTKIGLSGPEFLALRQQQKSCVDVLAWTSDQVSMQEAGHLQRVRIQSISENAFHLLEIQPFLGRPFEEQDSASEASQTTPVILSFEFWQRHYDGDRGVLGKTFVLSDRPVTVIGVMPPTFEGLTANFNPMIYTPLPLAGSEVRNTPGRFSYFVLGRLKPGMTIANAEAELKLIEPVIRSEADPEGTYLNHVFKSFHLTVTSGRSGVSWVKTTFERPILVIEMLVALLLLFCCVNTALVMLARVSEHQEEYALRVALGAGRFRLVRQIVVESVLLTLPGLAGGVLLGWGAAKVLVTMLGYRGNVASMDVSPNAYIVLFNCSIGLLIALSAGAWPALRAIRAAETGELRNANRTVAGTRFGGWLVALQVAISLCLISSAALTGETLTRLLSQHSGLRPEGAAVASISLTDLHLQKSDYGRIAGQLLDEIRNETGIEAAGITSVQPLDGYFSAIQSSSLGAQGVPITDPNAYQVTVSPGYFEAIGTRLVAGNVVPANTTNDSARCILSRSLARLLFPKRNPIGETVYIAPVSQSQTSSFVDKNACQVTGIAEDARLVSLRSPAPKALYSVIRPETLSSPVVMIIARGHTDALAIAGLRNAVKRTVPNSPWVQYRTVTELKNSDLNRERMLISLAGSFAVLALMLTALGLYGLMMRSVNLRSREIGIRIALGASKRSIVVNTAKRAASEVGGGILLGVAIAVAITDLTQRLLGGRAATNVSIYLIGVALILVVSLLSAYIPTKRAMAVDPIKALRNE